MEPSQARLLWQRLEAVHAVTYFSPESRQAMRHVGMHGFWMGYFAGRAAPLGAVGPEVVEATFSNFHPAMVRRAIPDAWALATPETVLTARAEAATAALRRLVPDAERAGGRLADLLGPVIQGASGSGRPLFAANRDLVPDDALARVWQAATALREHRGDGHVALLTASGLDGCEAHVLYAASEGVDPALLRDNRGWSAQDWSEASRRLTRRGLIEADGSPTVDGLRLRTHVEAGTDQLACQAYARLDDGDVQRVLSWSAALADPIVASGQIPFPNPMGLIRSA